MSAIFGIINKKGEAVSEEMIDKMQSSLLHRAVDGKAIFKEGNIMFGHHKLIVHRRQAQEQQPLQIDDYIITCDARIDNIEELFIQLELKKTAENFTDPFIILQAYKKWGDDCANHLEGEFCFVICKRSDKIFAAADHIGFKTFYYYENQEIWAFASEIKALQAIKDVPFELNEEIFFNPWLTTKILITYDKNIHFLQASHFLQIANNSIKIRRYWLAQKTKKYKFKDRKDWYACVVKLVTDKIKYQIDSDYPIGILLSGGLDSSFVAAVACNLLKLQNRKLHAFCAVLPEHYAGPEKDERFYIEKLRDRFDNLEIHYVTVPDSIGPYSNLEEIFNRRESPIPILHYVDTALYNEAKKLKVRTLISGIGGDEAISEKGGGVIFYYITKLKIVKAFRLLLKKYFIENESFLNQIKSEILRHLAFYRTIGSFIHQKKNQTLEIPLNQKLQRKIRNSEKPSNVRYFATSINSGRIGYTLLLLEKNAQNFRIQQHFPLINKNIVEMFLSMPREMVLLNGRKRNLIKECMKEIVPWEITNRIDKMAFSPDFEKRLSKLDINSLHKYIKDKTALEDIVGVNFDTLAFLITEIKKKDSAIDLYSNEFVYIPITILLIEFYLWVQNSHK